MTRANSSDRAAPEAPGDFGARSWWQVAKRVVREFQDDELTDKAAALTYYAVLSIFPALLAFVSILGLVGERATDPLRENLQDFAPGPGRDIADGVVKAIENNQGGAGFFTIVGIALALYSASGYIGAYGRAANAVYDIGEGRPIWKTLPLRLGVTTAMVLLLAVTSLAVLVSGGLADRAGDLFSIGDTGVLVWEIAKWPAVLFLVMVMLTILNWTMPNVHQPGIRWITPGSILATVVWAVASAGFALYVANFGSYNETYGTLAGAVILLVWLWITNTAVLLGVELNAELERQRAIATGAPADQEPYVEPREDPDDN